jgi:hypothetical protein
MSRITLAALSVGLLFNAEFVAAQRARQLGHAIVEFRSPDVKAVAAYEYSRRNHSGEWLLIEFAVQAQKRIAIERTEINLLTSDERRILMKRRQATCSSSRLEAAGPQARTAWL